MLEAINLDGNWSEISECMLYETFGGVNWTVVAGGAIVAAIGVVAVGAAAIAGGAVAGPAGAAAAAKACFTTVARPCLVTGATSICLGMMV